MRGTAKITVRFNSFLVVICAVVVCIAVVHGFTESATAQAPSSDSSIQLDISGLKSTLRKDGLEDRYLEQVFSDDRMQVDMNVLRMNIFPSEKPADYSQFFTSEALQNCKSFMGEHGELLEKVQREYGVEKEVVTAILLVESWFGKHTGKHRVFNVYIGLVLANTPENAGRVYRMFKDQYPNATLAQIQARIERRAKWAYKELVQLLQFGQRDGLDVLELKGSWAGAFGLPQFLPSSFVNYAIDGNRDNRVDLYDLPDAVASISNYLKSMGWRPGISEQRQKRLVMTYNNSSIYADTILEVASNLKKKEKSSSRPSVHD